MNLTIGKKESGANFHWPDGLQAVTQTFAILAKKGKGKSYTASVTAEELLKAGQQIVVLDPTGAWFGLQSSADGKKAGFPVVVFGGDHANVPLEQGAGEIIAQAIVEKGFSVIIDLSLFRKGETSRFVTLFLETIYRLNRKPLHLFIDEADDLCPQRPFGEEAKMVGAVEDVVKRGRKKGIGCTLITQRPADLAKQVLTQCEVLITLGLNHPRDIDAIKEWVGVHGDPHTAKEMIASLPSLPRGKAWIWSPGWGDLFELVSIRKRETFDSGATPKPGETITQPKALAPIDIEALGKTIAETVERKKADDPKALKAKILELEKKLAQPAKPGAKNHVPDSTKLVERAVAARDKHWQTEIAKLTRDYERRNRLVIEGRNKINDGLGIQIGMIVVPDNAVPESVPERVKSVPERVKSVPNVPRSVPIRSQSVPTLDGEALKINPMQQRILDAIAWYESIGNMNPSTLQVGAIALIDSTGGHFSNTVGPLSSFGLVTRTPGMISLTDKGREFATVPDSVGTLDDYHEVLRSRLRKAKSAGGKSVEILNAIIAKGGESMTTEEIGLATGMDHTGGHFSNMIGPLGTLGLIRRERGVVTPTDIIFPPGLS
jgi:hypothetical protein